MSPDRKFFEYLKRKEPHRFGLFLTMVRIGAPAVIIIALLSGVAETLDFRSKNRFDANKYPASDFVLFELSAAVSAVIAGRFFVLSLKKY